MYPAQETARIAFFVVAKSYQICCPKITDNNLCEVKSRYYRLSKVHSSALSFWFVACAGMTCNVRTYGYLLYTYIYNHLIGMQTCLVY